MIKKKSRCRNVYVIHLRLRNCNRAQTTSVRFCHFRHKDIKFIDYQLKFFFQFAFRRLVNKKQLRNTNRTKLRYDELVFGRVHSNKS